MGNICCCAFKGIVNPKMIIVSSFTHPRSKPVKPSFIFGTQIKIFLIKSESFLAPSVSWYSREWQQRLTLKRRNHWIKLFLFSLRTKSILVADVTWTILMMSLLPFWALNISVALLSMQGQKALGFHQKYLNLCSEDEWRSYGFGMTWGCVINDRIFIFGWTKPLRLLCNRPFHMWCFVSEVQGLQSESFLQLCSNK